VKGLNGVDALMLYTETPEVHMHTLKIGVLMSNVRGIQLRPVSRRRVSAVAGHGAAALSAGRHPR
jgi:hypothetical protein